MDNLTILNTDKSKWEKNNYSSKEKELLKQSKKNQKIKKNEIKEEPFIIDEINKCYKDEPDFRKIQERITFLQLCKKKETLNSEELLFLEKLIVQNNYEEFKLTCKKDINVIELEIKDIVDSIEFKTNSNLNLEKTIKDIKKLITVQKFFNAIKPFSKQYIIFLLKK